jgi:hypothetical protein
MLSFMVSTFKEASTNQADDNATKQKLQSNFALDDEVIDEFQTVVDLDDCNKDT